jgi:hypothetical protein
MISRYWMHFYYFGAEGPFRVNKYVSLSLNVSMLKNLACWMKCLISFFSKKKEVEWYVQLAVRCHCKLDMSRDVWLPSYTKSGTVSILWKLVFKEFQFLHYVFTYPLIFSCWVVIGQDIWTGVHIKNLELEDYNKIIIIKCCWGGGCMQSFSL